jgi:DNA-binding response OmpR family regulator
MTRLLLVTQFPDERAIYGDALRAEGFDVRIADGPDDALVSALREPPDMVVTRVPQPGSRVPHSDLLRRLKGESRTRAVPVVIITSLGQPEHRASAVVAGCDGYLLIPALPDTLVEEVRRILMRRPASGAPPRA